MMAGVEGGRALPVQGGIPTRKVDHPSQLILTSSDVAEEAAYKGEDDMANVDA